MKILCIIESLGSGGAERQLSGLAVMLKDEGYKVRIMTYIPKDFYKPYLDKAGVECQYLPTAQRRYKRLPVLAKAISQYSPNTVIAYSPSAAEIACALKKIGFKFKLIVSERNTSQTNCIREKIKFFSYRWADWVVPNSNMQAKFILNNYPQLVPKMRVITNFVDTDYFCPNRTQIDYNSNCNMICVGRDNPQKNQLRFFEAIKLLTDKGVNLHVDWYGNFESSYGLQCKNRIIELNLEKQVTLKGETRNIRDEYRKHDVFCLPSIYEGFPNVLCEAMSCGLPVLCSNVCDNPLIVEEGINGYLFDPQNVEEMAERILAFVALDNDKKIKMGKENRKKALEMFSSMSFLLKYQEIL
jgi:glycosyltransferase involved in cell wall biosynthesis